MLDYNVVVGWVFNPTITFKCKYLDKKCKFMDIFVTKIGHFGLFDSINFRPYKIAIIY